MPSATMTNMPNAAHADEVAIVFSGGSPTGRREALSGSMDHIQRAASVTLAAVTAGG
jgi:hypothetical protein